MWLRNTLTHGTDDRKDKPNLLPFGPMLLGMQFLTSGFLLTYLFMRTPEKVTGEESFSKKIFLMDGSSRRY